MQFSIHPAHHEVDHQLRNGLQHEERSGGPCTGGSPQAPQRGRQAAAGLQGRQHAAGRQGELAGQQAGGGGAERDPQHLQGM